MSSGSGHRAANILGCRIYDRLNWELDEEERVRGDVLGDGKPHAQQASNFDGQEPSSFFAHGCIK